MPFTPRPSGPMSEDRKKLHSAVDDINRARLINPNVRLSQTKEDNVAQQKFFMASERLKRALSGKDDIRKELNSFEDAYIRTSHYSPGGAYDRSYEAQKHQQEQQSIREMIEQIRHTEGH